MQSRFIRHHGMRTLCGVVLLTSSLLSVVSCSNGLTPSSATETIRADLAMTAADVVEVTAISDSGRNQAIARATIKGGRMRLRFRRSHDRWIWEAAETGTGTWVAAHEVVEQVREATRRAKAQEWAIRHRDAYIGAVKFLDQYTADLPRRLNSPFDGLRWVRDREERFARVPATAAIGERAPEGRGAQDAWGSEILWSFQATERTAVFRSSGPDRTIGTTDDLILSVTGEVGWDDVDKQPIYKYSKRWTVPEGLEAATRAAVGTDTVDVQPSRVVTK